MKPVELKSADVTFGISIPVSGRQKAENLWGA